MATERRLTMHNGRSHKGGKVFSAKHNEHLENGNWDPEKRNECYFWKSKNCPGETFDAGEKAFYEKFFRKALDAQNERHKKSRHLERVKTMDDYRKCKNYCPEETLFYLGDKENCAPKEQLLEVMKEYVKWHTQEYPLAKILDFALHDDEDGAPHVHMRKVWMAKDKDGHWMVGQNKSLDQMGIKPPQPNEEVTGDNNAKMTYTAICREKLYELAKEKGVELVEEPRSKEESGKSRGEYIEGKRMQALERLSSAIQHIFEQLVALKPKEREKEKDLFDWIGKHGKVTGQGSLAEIKEATAYIERQSARLADEYRPIEDDDFER